jgi:hypothetical protein
LAFPWFLPSFGVLSRADRPPLVAEFLDQGGNEVSNGVIGMDRRLRIKLLHGIDDRRGILNASASGGFFACFVQG